MTCLTVEKIPDCVIQYELDRLFYLSAGKVEGTPTDLLTGAAMQKLLDDLRGLFHLVVFDSPPVIPIADTVTFAGMVDGVVLVAKSRDTSRKIIMQALDDLQGKRILGVVLNALDYRLAGGQYKYGYGGYGGYGYGSKSTPARVEP